MSTTTPNLGLFKYDPANEGELNFDIQQALNDNWDKIDTRMVEHTHTLVSLGAAAASHTHTKSNITDFPTTMTPSAHTHAQSDITGLAAALSATGSCQSLTYNGNGALSKTLTFTKQPKIVIVLGNSLASIVIVASSSTLPFFYMAGSSGGSITTSWSGTSVTFTSTSSQAYYNYSGRSFTAVGIS